MSNSGVFMISPRPLLVLSFLALAHFQFQFAVGKLVNVTIDDTKAGPDGSFITYLGPWNIGTDCTGCTAHPDPAQVLDGTWHDVTFDLSKGSLPSTASVTFNGTAVYVFCVLARTTTKPDGDSDMSFFVDGNLTGIFVKKAPGTAGYDYNVSVFSTTSLSPGFHNLTLQNGRVNGSKSLVLLDSIVYSFDDGEVDSFPSSSFSSSSSLPSPVQASSSATPTGLSDASSSRKSGIVAAAVVVPLLVITLAVATVILCCRRRRRQQSINDIQHTVIDPFIPTPTGRAQPRNVNSPPVLEDIDKRLPYINATGLPVSESNFDTTSYAPSLPPLRRAVLRSKSLASRLTSSSGASVGYQKYAKMDYAQRQSSYTESTRLSDEGSML